MVRRNTLLYTTAMAVIVFGAGYVRTARSQQNSNAAPAASAHRAFLDRNCVGCHNQRLNTAGIKLDQVDINNVPANAEIWEKVIRKVRTGTMPPANLPRPDAAQSEAFLTYIETSLDTYSARNVNPGRATLHRLNRNEYANAVRDLLDLKVDVSQLLPPDDESYGFDNNADVLGVSPILLEQYLSASAKVARLAVGDPDTSPIATTYRTRPDLSQDKRVEGMPLGTRGGLLTEHNFPLNGEYIFKVLLARNTVDVIRGLEEEHELQILIDGALVFSHKLGGKEDTDKLTKNPTEMYAEVNNRLTVKVPVKAGPHKVGVTFVQKNRAQEDHILEPFLRTTLDPVNEAGLPHVENIVVAGPYNATGAGDTPSRTKIFTCKPGQGKDDIGCAREILSRLSRQAYRRPVDAKDMEPLLTLYQRARNDGRSFDQAVESALRLILANPQFVFRMEPEPTELAAGSVYKVNDLELASRLAFFLWSSVPDEPLLALAEQGKLRDNAVLEQQVRRMLNDPRSDALVKNFASQWLYLRNIKNTFPDPQEFPNFDDNLRHDLQIETEMFLGSIFREDHNIMDLLRADYTFMNERVAKHYGVAGIYGNRFRRVKLEDEARYGLLGQASLLSVTSHTTRTSPVVRGKWILSNLLGTPPPPPPPDVPALKEKGEPGAAASVRERMELHRASPQCAGCHAVMDPLGFALENFDATGRWRTLDNGAPIDTGGKLADGTAVNSPKDLRNAILGRPDVFAGTFTEKLLTYALGRGIDYNDMPVVRGIVRDAKKTDYRFSSVVMGIVKSVPFQMKSKTGPEGSAVAELQDKSSAVAALR